MEPRDETQQQDVLLGTAGVCGLASSAAGQAFVENCELRFATFSFKEAVRAVVEIRETAQQEVAALSDALIDALADVSTDSLKLRAAFFLSSSLLTSSGSSLAQQLDLLSALTAVFEHCLVRDSRTVLRTYRLLRSAALAAAASLDSVALKGKRKDASDVPALTLSLVHNIVFMPIATQSACAAAGDETINVLMQRAFEPALPSLRQVVVSVFGACTASSQPAAASQVLRAISMRWEQPSASKAADAAAVAAGDLILQCAGISRECTAMCSVFLSPMLESVFNSALPMVTVRYCLQLVSTCADYGACSAEDAMSIMLAASYGKMFDAPTRAVAVRLAGSLGSAHIGAGQTCRFVDHMTRLMEQRQWHTETKTVRLEVLKSIQLVVSHVRDKQLISSSLISRLARQLHILLAEVLTYDPADAEQFMGRVCQALATLPSDQLNVASLMACMLPIQQHTEVQSEASHQLSAVAATCLVPDSVLSRKNWQVLAVSCLSQRQALRSFVCSLRKLHRPEVDAAMAIHPMHRFIKFIEEQPDVPYENLHELQLLAVCADSFAEITREMLGPLCIHLRTSSVSIDPASTACVLQILEANIRTSPETRTQVMEIFNDHNAVSTFIKCGLHKELLDIIWTTHNRRKNSLSLITSMIHAAAESTQESLCPVIDLCGELALYFCDYQKIMMEKATAEYRHNTEAKRCENGEDDDDFNYMTREEQRREDVEAIEEAVSAIVQNGGPLHLFFPMITSIVGFRSPVNAPLSVVKAQTSAVVSLGKFMANSRQLAEDQVPVVANVLARSHHSLVKHAALAVLADMTMFIPTHTALHREDGQCFLVQLLDDKVLGRAALHQLLRLCNLRVVHAAAHLGALASAMMYEDNVANIKAFFANYLRTTGKQGHSTKETKARLIYKTYCDLPKAMSNDEKHTIMLQLITSFCDSSIEKELTALLAKRLIEHVDATAAALLYSRRNATAHVAPALVNHIEKRNLAALVVRLSIAKDKSLSEADRSELRNAACVTQSIYKLLSLPSVQRVLSTNRTVDRSGALSAATKHLCYVSDHIATTLHLDVNESAETFGSGDSCPENQTASSEALNLGNADTSDTVLDNAPNSQAEILTPSGPELYSKIQNILKTSDHSVLTKKTIQSLLADELSTQLVEANKDAINQMILDAMKQQLAKPDSAKEDESMNQGLRTSATPSLEQQSSAVDTASSCNTSGWAGMEEEEETVDELVGEAEAKKVESPRMREFLEAAVAVAGSAVKRSADAISTRCAEGVKNHSTTFETEAGRDPAAKRLHV